MSRTLTVLAVAGTLVLAPASVASAQSSLASLATSPPPVTSPPDSPDSLPQVTGIAPFARPWLGTQGAMWDLPADPRILCGRDVYGHECYNASFEVEYSTSDDMSDSVIANVGPMTYTEAHPRAMGSTDLFIRVRVVTDDGQAGPWSAISLIDFSPIPTWE